MKIKLFAALLILALVASFAAAPPVQTQAAEADFASMVDMSRTAAAMSTATTDAGSLKASPVRNGKIYFRTAAFTTNYFTLEYSASAYLRCELGYTVDGIAKTEEFFLQAGDNQTFRSFLDGMTDRRLSLKYLYFEDDRITPSGKIAVTLNSLRFISRETPPPMAYLTNQYYKLGIDMNMGGAITYLEDLKNKPVIFKEDHINKITLNQSVSNKLYTNVNLINRADTGRDVQQSFYGSYNPRAGAVAPDGYVYGSFAGTKWRYNPVQGGDVSMARPKIVDFVQTATSIYIKCRPMDWGQVNKITPSYMENTYSFVGGVIQVDNGFTDFSKYHHEYSAQELPAAYFIEPLRTFWWYGGVKKYTLSSPMNSWEDRTFWGAPGGGISTTATYGLTVWTSETGQYGVGLYNSLPYSRITAGVFEVNDHIGAQYDGTPDYAGPTSYTAYCPTMQLINGATFEYRYLLCAGTMTDIRKAIQANEAAAVTYKVTLDAGDGGGHMPLYANRGMRVYPPQDPARNGNIFLGWYTDPQCTRRWDFNKDKVMGDMTLYAGWKMIVRATAASYNYNKVRLAIDWVDGADGYQVFRSDAKDGPYTYIGGASSDAYFYVSSNLVSGKTYYYKLRAFSGSGANRVYSAFSSVVSASPVPRTPVIRVTKTSSGVRLSWAAIGGANGYEIYKADKTGQYRLYTTVKTTQLNLKPGSKQTFRIRAYRMQDGKKVYSVYSKACTIGK